MASHALESLGRNEEAVRAAGEAVRLAPLTWQGHARFAATLSASGGDLRLARQAAGYAVQLAPDEPDAHSAMGLVALRQGDHDTAERAFKHVLSLQPEHHSALNNLAVVQLRRRDLDGALHGFSAAIRSEPQQEVARRNVDVVVRAVLYRAQWFVFIAAYITRQLISRHTSSGAQVVISRPERGRSSAPSLRSRLPAGLEPAPDPGRAAPVLAVGGPAELGPAAQHRGDRRRVRHPARGDRAGQGAPAAAAVSAAAALMALSRSAAQHGQPAGRAALAAAIQAPLTITRIRAQPLH